MHNSLIMIFSFSFNYVMCISYTQLYYWNWAFLKPLFNIVVDRFKKF